jgi:hypothetical protein
MFPLIPFNLQMPIFHHPIPFLSSNVHIFQWNATSDVLDIIVKDFVLLLLLILCPAPGSDYLS